MTIFYHGTTTNNAIRIARDGALLSPWEQEIKSLQRLKEKSNAGYKRILKGFQERGIKDEEDIALELAKIGFGEYETEFRVKCVALTPDISWLFCVPHYETILGIELEHPSKDNIFIPRKAQLDALTEVHFKEREQELRTAFARYKPKFIKI